MCKNARAQMTLPCFTLPAERAAFDSAAGSNQEIVGSNQEIWVFKPDGASNGLGIALG